jgi:hypothetical protein
MRADGEVAPIPVIEAPAIRPPVRAAFIGRGADLRIRRRSLGESLEVG